MVLPRRRRAVHLLGLLALVSLFSQVKGLEQAPRVGRSATIDDVVEDGGVSRGEGDIGGKPRSASGSTTPARVAKPWEHFLAGTAGGMCGVLMSHPLDTLRVRMQTSVKRITPLQMFSDILSDAGVRGFYRGVASPVAGAGLIKASVFGGYGVFKDLVRRFAEQRGEDLSLWHVGVAAMGAGFVASFVVAPVERIKVVMQAMNSANEVVVRESGLRAAVGRGLGSAGGGMRGAPAYANSWACARGLVAEHGVFKGLFTGLGATLAREIPGYAMYFATYEVSKHLLMGGKVGKGEEGASTRNVVLKTALAGGLAGMSAWLPVYPVDVVKSRVQSGAVGGPGMLDTAMMMWRTEGFSSFFKGLAATLARGAVNHSATFVVYETVVDLMVGRRYESRVDEQKAEQPAVKGARDDKEASTETGD